MRNLGAVLRRLCMRPVDHKIHPLVLLARAALDLGLVSAASLPPLRLQPQEWLTSNEARQSIAAAFQSHQAAIVARLQGPTGSRRQRQRESEAIPPGGPRLSCRYVRAQYRAISRLEPPHPKDQVDTVCRPDAGSSSLDSQAPVQPAGPLTPYPDAVPEPDALVVPQTTPEPLALDNTDADPRPDVPRLASSAPELQVSETTVSGQIPNTIIFQHAKGETRFTLNQIPLEYHPLLALATSKARNYSEAYKP